MVASRYTLPTAAALILIVYAAIYSIFLIGVAVQGFGASMLGSLYVLMLLALATTPFLALIYLPKSNGAPIGRVAVWMSIVMACPSIVFGYSLSEIIAEIEGPAGEELLFVFGLVGIPAVLSIYLCLVFVRTVHQERGNAT